MQNLIIDILGFCEDHGLSESQFGIMALNDKNFIPQLRDGRDIRISTSEKVRAFMAGYTSKPSDRAA